MKPKIIYSTRILKRFSLFMDIAGIALFPFVILKDSYKRLESSARTQRIIRHESIHIKQQLELLVLPFYVWYFVEWFIRLFGKGSAYRNISFEREAKANENDNQYLKTRKLFSFLKYI